MILNPVDFLLLPGELAKLQPKKVLVAFMAAVQYHDVLYAFNHKVMDEEGDFITTEQLQAAFEVFHDSIAEALNLPDLKGEYGHPLVKETNHE